MAADQIVEHFGAFGGAAAALAEVGQLVLLGRVFPLAAGELLLGSFQGGGLLLHLPGQFRAAAADLFEFPLQAVQGAVQFGQALGGAAAGGRGGGGPALQPALLIGQRGGLPHLLDVGRATLLRLAAEPFDRGHHLGQPPLGLVQPAHGLEVVFFGRFERGGGVAQLLLEVAGPGAHGGELAAVPGDLLLQLGAAAPLMLDAGLGGGDPLAVGGGLGLRPADLLA